MLLYFTAYFTTAHKSRSLPSSVRAYRTLEPVNQDLTIDMDSNKLDSELESFRQQWLSEVRTKKGEQSTPGPSTSSASTSAAQPVSPPSPRSRKSRARVPSPVKSRKALPVVEDEDEYLHGRSFDEGPEPAGNTIDGSVRMPPEKELVSALDHYEEAMEKEALGNMGDSLKLYRKAYRVCKSPSFHS